MSNLPGGSNEEPLRVGLIERRLRSKANQEFAATRRLTTSLPIDEAREQIIRTCNDINAGTASKLKGATTMQAAWIGFRDADLLGTYSARVMPDRNTWFIDYPTTQPSNGTLRKSGWIGKVVLPPQQPSDGSVVELSLLRWTIDGNHGRIRNKKAWEIFSEALANALLE